MYFEPSWFFTESPFGTELIGFLAHPNPDLSINASIIIIIIIIIN